MTSAGEWVPALEDAIERELVRTVLPELDAGGEETRPEIVGVPLRHEGLDTDLWVHSESPPSCTSSTPNHGHIVNAYSYSYASLGRERFLEERLGGSPQALAALARAESLADGEKLWITNFSSATLEALRDLLVLAQAQATLA